MTNDQWFSIALQLADEYAATEGSGQTEREALKSFLQRSVVDSDRNIEPAHHPKTWIEVMHGVRIPLEVLEAERLVSDWFKQHNISAWKLGGSQARIEELQSLTIVTL